MRRRAFVLLLVALIGSACGRRPTGRALDAGADSTALVLAPRDSADSALLAPRVVRGPTVVVFWLASGDTLLPDDAAAVLDEMTATTEEIVPALAAYDIELLPTNADTVYVELVNRSRDVIVLSGLEYPFGYLLIEPGGGGERVLAGVYAAEELLDEIRAYFDLPADSLRAPPPKVAT